MLEVVGQSVTRDYFLNSDTCVVDFGKHIELEAVTYLAVVFFLLNAILSILKPETNMFLLHA